MTRVFKVSLSVIALLLVALIVFTGCGNEALTKAEQAEKAVAEATAELQAALAKKADAQELTDKVAALTAAIQAAETVATDGDAALKAAIEEAKATLTANVETLLKAHKVDVAGLLAGKASKEEVTNQVETLKKMIADIESATLAAIDLKAYVDWTTVAAVYAYELDELYEEMVEYKSLYSAEQWDAIKKAYKIAEVSIYRSFGTADDTSMVDAAFDSFKAVVAANPNDVDKLYYGTASSAGIAGFIADSNKTADNAKALFTAVLDEYNAASDKAKALITGYYVISADNKLVKANLLTDTLGYWKAQIAEDVQDLGRILPVYTGNAKYGKDAENFAATDAHLEAFAAILNVNSFDDGIVADFSEADLANYNSKKAFLTLIDDATNGAVALANAIKALEYTGDVALTHACVNAINEWDSKLGEWERTFLKKPANFNTADGLSENESRYIEMENLISETKAALNTAMAAVETLAAPYRADAKAFIDLITEFYVSADDKTIDTSKVDIYDGTTIVTAYNLAQTWADNYAGATDLALKYAQDEKKPAAALEEINTLKNYYDNAFDGVIDAWNEIDHNAIAGYIADIAAINVYDSQIAKAIAWFEYKEGDTFGFVVNGEFKNGCALAALANATEDYYNTLKSLAVALENAIADKAQKAIELNAALDALANIKYSNRADLDAVKELKAAYDATYDPENTELNELYGFTINYGTKIADAETKIATISAAKNTMDNAVITLNGLTVGTEYPFFGTAGLATKTEYMDAISDLEDAIATFIVANRDDRETFTVEAEAALASAKAFLKMNNNIEKTVNALADVRSANTALLDAIAALNEIPSYFTDDVTKEGFIDLQNTLTAKIAAYRKTLAASGMSEDALIAEAEATIAVADLILAKEDIYEQYKAYYDDAIEGADDALVAAIDDILDEHLALIDAYTAIEIEEGTIVDSNFAIFKATIVSMKATLVSNNNNSYLS